MKRDVRSWAGVSARVFALHAPRDEIAYLRAGDVVASSVPSRGSMSGLFGNSEKGHLDHPGSACRPDDVMEKCVFFGRQITCLLCRAHIQIHSKSLMHRRSF